MLIRILQTVCLIMGGLLTVAFAYQAVYLFVPFFKRTPEKTPAPQPGGKRNYAVLIAARNEEAVIGHLLDSLRAQTYPAGQRQIYVIADNCTDRTAQIAREHGATVFLRENREQVGKGYALAYLLEQLRQTPQYDTIDAFVIFDADNVLEPDYLEKLDRVAAMGYPVFSGYRNSKNFGSSWISAGHAMWYLHDSAHLNRSRMLLGVGCMVTGTGYGFTKALFEQLGSWPFHTLTEDIEFGTWCAVHGVKIGYAHDAVLYDEQPITFRTSWKQRTRWAQGGIQTSLAYFRQYGKGMTQGGWAGWTSFEVMTLSLWGYGPAGLCGVLAFVTALLSGGLPAAGVSLLAGLAGTYFSMLFIGGLTLLTEHKKLRATTGQKWMALFSFPVYVATYLPVAVCSVFHKFHWEPIPHTQSVSVQDLQNTP